MSDEEIQTYIKEQEAYIKSLEEKYVNAPDSLEYISDLKPVLEKDDIAQISFYDKNNDTFQGDILIGPVEQNNKQFNHIILRTDALSQERDVPVINISDAQNLADELIGKIDLKKEYALNRSYYDTVDKVFVFAYTKTYQGVPVTYTISQMAYDEMYFSYWPAEVIKVLVNDNGIIMVDWEAPSKIGQTMNENVELLDFEKIQQLFSNNIQYMVGLQMEDETIVKQEVNITEIRLGMMRVKMKETNDQYMVVPVWNFFGTLTDTYTGPQPGGYKLNENNQYTDEFYKNSSFLTINSIDGSVINRSLGY